MPSQYIWREKDPDGTKREVRATKFGGAWRFQSKSAHDLQWTYHDVPPLNNLLTLKEIIQRKYQRRRASTEDLASVEKLIRAYENNEQEPSNKPPLPFSKGKANKVAISSEKCD